MSFIISFIRALFNNMLQLLSFSKKTLTNSLNIYIKSNTGSTLRVDLDPKWDIKNVKEIVAPQLGLSPDELKIIFAGKELCDSTIIEDCDLGQQSVLHAVRSRKKAQELSRRRLEPDFDESLEEPTKPLCETLIDLNLQKEERSNISETEKKRVKAQFYVFCAQCNKLCKGKLRVRCSKCKGGAFTVHRDPECWDDVLKPRRITGHCESGEHACVDNELGDPPYTDFYFKCAEHPSQGETDFSVALYLIKANTKSVPCLACTDISEVVLVFPCLEQHVTCIDCFQDYCLSRLMERQFIPHPEIGYTLSCPVGCENSFIQEIHHFKLLKKDQYERYQRFAAEEFVLQAGGVLCPQPGCGMGLLVDSDCQKVKCEGGCGYVFCRNCRQGYHLGECAQDGNLTDVIRNCDYMVDPKRVQDARWEEESKTIIKILTKPCPKCRTPTERDGGCMHMVCTRAGCNFEWCWICQTEWTRDCMGAHWFG